MGYPVSKLNSCQFPFLGDTYALAIVPDEDVGNVVNVFKFMPDGEWFGTGAFIKTGLTNEDVMAHGSVAAYLQSLFPIAEQRLADLAIAYKPDTADKPSCAAFDLSLDVVFDDTTGRFGFNKTPPLSHAR